MEFKFKGALSDLGQFLEGKIPLKNDKIVISYSKSSVLKMFNFLDHLWKRLDKKAKDYDFTN